MSQQQQPGSGMSRMELRTALSLSSVYALRMLGLFMILPVFALYAGDLEGVTPTLTGLAIGIYGLTQAALQIPAGLLSDRIGRKPVIIDGLLRFALVRVVAALADSMLVVILGRALQGAGAIAAAIMATLLLLPVVGSESFPLRERVRAAEDHPHAPPPEHAPEQGVRALHEHGLQIPLL